MKKTSSAARLRRAVPLSLLASALQAQGDGVVISRIGTGSAKLALVFANDAFCAMIGCAAAELAGRPHASLHAERRDLRAPGRAGRNALVSGEGYLFRQDGETLYASWSFGVVRNRLGRATHLVATYRDKTEQRRLQEALVHAQRLDAVGRLAGGVAHDFNNLLSVINGYCEMLAAQVSDRPHALREVNEIHRSGLRAAALTRQLLAFGRRTPMDPRVISLNRIVQENAEIMERLIGPVGRLQLELAPDLGNVRTDPTQFQQVLLNLVINARDALRDRGCITLSTARREVKAGLNRRATDAPPGRYICLAVTDNGTGMDADTQKHLFEPFFTTKPEGKGTGLGLALAYGVVQQSSGYIQVRSELLAGSTFEILLPEVNQPEEITHETDVSPLPSNSGHETLLLIEDDDVVRKMVAGMLAASGYRVLAAGSASEAAGLAASAERPVQLLMGPLEDGGEALVRKLGEQNPKLRFLCIANQDTPAPLAGLPEKRQAAIAKPFALSEILRMARTLLDA